MSLNVSTTGSYPEQVCMQIMQMMADITQEPRRAEFPYYAYGRRSFFDQSQTPPMVRIKTDEEINISADLAYQGGVLAENSWALWSQFMVARIWGVDEANVQNETMWFLQAARLVDSTFFAGEGGMQLVYAEKQNEKVFGEHIDVRFRIRMGVPHPETEHVPIATFVFTASLGNEESASSALPQPILSGSQDERSFYPSYVLTGSL